VEETSECNIVVHGTASFLSSPASYARQMILKTPLFAALLGTLSIAGLGCDRNIEPFVPGEEPSKPDLSRIFPEEGEGPGPGLGSGEPTGGAPPMARRGAPPVAPAAPAAQAAASGDPIRGRIEVAPSLAAAVPSPATLFLIARRAGQSGGPPLAVLRVAAPELPLDFEIGPENAMIQGIPFAGSIQLTARLDADGDAMTRGDDDLSGAAAQAHEPGATSVSIVLDQRGN